MIVDTSALMAILLREPERVGMLNAISRAETRLISAPNWLETCMVIDRRNNIHASSRIGTILRQLGIEIAPFEREHVEIARQAFEVYGKGSKHPAQLNYGDCMAYALAWAKQLPLLFKGKDFIHTNIEPVPVDG